MAIMEILAYPNPFLRQKAKPVEVFDEALKQAALDMEETMVKRKGVGLAATQVGLDLRMLILDPYIFDEESGRDQPNLVVINPKVIWESEVSQVGEEGCLSFPGIYIHVERPEKVRIRAFDVNGASYEIEGEGLGARAILHEIDHLEGVVMIDHVSTFVRRRAIKKHQKNQKLLAEDAKENKKK